MKAPEAFSRNVFQTSGNRFLKKWWPQTDGERIPTLT
jgi:hypothetical protein